MDLFTIENITLFIALWGAVLSTLKVLSDYLKDVRKLKVYLAYGFLTQGRSIGPATIIINAINTGHRDMTLSSMGFILPDNNFLFIVEPQSNVRFPYTLSEGRQCSVWKTQKELAEELRKNGYSGKIKLRGYYRSETEKTFKSKPIDFAIEEIIAKNE